MADKRVLIAVAAAGGVAGLLYLLYKRWSASVKEADEGFSDSEKDSSEPLPKRVLVLGLDGAGKTCLLEALASQSVPETETQPTEGFNVISVQNEKAGNVDIWEIGGEASVRKYWSNFIQDTDVLVFVIDSADRNRFPDAYSEMHKLLGEPRLLEKPFVVLANKQDLPNAANSDQIKEALGLEDIKHHRVQIIETSITQDSLTGIPQVKDILCKI